MLVLSRKRGERVVIGGGIHVVVLGVRGETVQLGFDAPGSVTIHREEVHRRIEQEQQQQQAATVDEEAAWFAVI